LTARATASILVPVQVGVTEMTGAGTRAMGIARLSTLA
jgi:hypothetical protein